MLNLHKKYVDETFDENGLVTGFNLKFDEDYNFAYDVVDEIAKYTPDRRAMLWTNEDGEEITFTFGDLKKYSDKTANVLKDLGVGKGDVVMLILKRHYQFWFAILACHKLGAIAVPASNQLQLKDLVYRYNAATVKAIICTSDDKLPALALEAAKQCPSVTVFLEAFGRKTERDNKVITDGWLSFDDLVDAASDELARQEVKAADPMLMYFTSGTTGYPKMVLHDYSYSLGHLNTAKWWQNVDPEGLHFTLSDTGWGKAVWGKLYGQWLMEAAVFTYDFNRFTPNDLLPLFAKHKITTFCAPPTMFRFFIKEDLSKYDLSTLKYTTIAGEALNPEVYNVWLKHTGIKLMEGFGQTETTLIIANLVGMEPRPGSMGKPVPQYDVDIVDENGDSVPAGVTGEIVIRTDKRKQFGLFLGYYRDEELTNKAWHDGMYHTGDTAWKDEDGYYWYVGRTDDIIKSSGYRIGPFEIESVLMEHPSVLECAVTGVPDPVRGQLVKATIVLVKGYTASEELKKELQDFVKKLTAPYKYPRAIEFVTELPKTISGKIRRTEIREKDNA